LDAIQRIYFVLTKWFASATVPPVLIFVFFPESTLRAVFGPSFVVAAPALQLLAFAFCVGNLMGPTGATLTALGHTRALMAVNLVATVLNFGLNVFFIPRIGLMGAAVGTAVALVFRNLLRLGLLYRYGRIHALKGALFKPLVPTSGVAAIVSVVFSPVSLLGVVVVFVGLSIFFVGSFRLTRSVSDEDSVLVSFATAQVSRVGEFGP
jgi:O-antigen/teichoic acid export membrane protein